MEREGGLVEAQENMYSCQTAVEQKGALCGAAVQWNCVEQLCSGIVWSCCAVELCGAAVQW